MVERCSHKADVAGSIPATGTIMVKELNLINLQQEFNLDESYAKLVLHSCNENPSEDFHWTDILLKITTVHSDNMTDPEWISENIDDSVLKTLYDKEVEHKLFSLCFGSDYGQMTEHFVLVVRGPKNLLQYMKLQDSSFKHFYICEAG